MWQELNRRIVGITGAAGGYAGAVTVPRDREAHPAPASVRGAGLIVAVQGAAGLVVANVLVVRAVAGADQRVVNGFGTAVWFFLVGAAVLAAGWGLLRGKRGGRGFAVFTQLLVLPIAWYLAVGSHRPLFGVPTAALAVTALVLLFSRPALRWAAGDQRGSANAANSGPETG
jgi:peptidoglycan/LPS O-acetylase OafA/YrhL